MADVDRAAQDVATSEWGISAPVERVDIGVNKATWRVGDHWLTCDYPRVAEQVRRMQLLLARLAAGPGWHLAVPRLVPGGRGLVVYAHDRVWWLTEHLGGRQPDPASAADTAAVAEGLAGLHACLYDLPTTLAVSDEDTMSLFEAGARLATEPRLSFTPEDHGTVAEAADLVRRRLTALRGLGVQLVHGDPSNPNLRMQDDPLRLTGVLDWDNARVDLVMADVATVAQTVVFRSGTTTPVRALEVMIEAYAGAGGVPMTLDDLLLALIMVKFESIAHHGGRYLRGETGYDMVSGQVDKIRTVLGIRASR